MKRKLSHLLKVLVPLLGLLVLSACDSYSDLLKKQGYTVLKHPRTNFGTGTIVNPFNADRELYVSSLDECFPGLKDKIHEGAVKLLDSRSTKNLSADAAAKYLPGSPEQIGGAFGYKSVKSLDVQFGSTTASDLTVEGLAQFLDGKKTSKRCIAHLTNPKNLIILSAARVDSLEYKFHGEKEVNGSVNADALKQVLSADGSLKYSSTRDDTLAIQQPMYIAYSAYKFQDLGIVAPESDDAEVLLKLDKNFKLVKQEQ